MHINQSKIALGHFLRRHRHGEQPDIFPLFVPLDCRVGPLGFFPLCFFFLPVAGGEDGCDGLPVGFLGFLLFEVEGAIELFVGFFGDSV